MTDRSRPRSPIVKTLIVVAVVLSAIAFFLLVDIPRLVVSMAAIAVVLGAVYIQRRAERKTG